MDFSKTARLYHHETNAMSLRSKALMLHYILLYLYMKFTKNDDYFCCPHFYVINKSYNDKQFNGRLHSAINR